ncbi:hypothetical protein N7490_005203 [Penicillium lividum]|nr:hypothetical protein N7490_005203 [Penicillium lividum]
MSSQEAVPSSNSSDHRPQDHEESFAYNSSPYSLIQKLVHQEQELKSYQGQLESRIHSDVEVYNKLRAYCQQLERMIIGVQYQKSQFETSLFYTSEAYRVVTRDLQTERYKVQRLESRLNELHPTIELVLERLRRHESNERWLNNKEKHDNDTLENIYQVMHTSPDDAAEEQGLSEELNDSLSESSCEILI